MLATIKQILNIKVKYPYKTVNHYICDYNDKNMIMPLYLQQVTCDMYDYVQNLSTKALCLYFLILVSKSYDQVLEEKIRVIMLNEIKYEIIKRYIPVDHAQAKSLIYIYIYIILIIYSIITMMSIPSGI